MSLVEKSSADPTRAARQAAWVLAARRTCRTACADRPQGERCRTCRAAADAAAAAVADVDGIIWRQVGRYRARFSAADLEDMAAHARVELLDHAVRKFDPAIASWVTYAAWWVRHACTRWVATEGHLVRVAINKSPRVRALRDAAARLSRDLGRGVTAAEVAEVVGRAVDETEVLRARGAVVVSIDEEVFPGSARTLLDEIEGDVGGGDAEGDASREERAARVRAAVGGLPPLLRRVVERRLEDATLAEVGDELGVSRERARQLVARALERLRRALADLGGPGRGEPRHLRDPEERERRTASARRAGAARRGRTNLRRGKSNRCADCGGLGHNRAACELRADA